MDRKGNHPSTSKGEPPSKKRKTESFAEEEENAELWDDEDFTAADLDDITDQEIRASQAYRPSTSHQPSSVSILERDTSDTFLKPHLSRSSSSFGSHSTSASSRQSRSSSILSNNSIPGHHNSDSSYPASLSGYSGTSSSSIRSGEQVNITKRHLSNGSSSDSEGTTARDEISRYKRECEKLKQKVSKLNEELSAKDGENKLLRDNLVKKEGELDTIKSEKVNLIHQQNKQQSEKEKNLQNEVTRLQTQLQFKEQDERELSNRVKELETQISGLQTAPSTSHTVPQQLSPKPSKVLVKDISPDKPSKLGFPTKRTFLAPEGSPRKQVKVSTESPSTSRVQISDPVKRENQLKLNVKFSRRPRECQLVSKSLDITPSVSGQTDSRSIVGLLNTPWISSVLQNVQFDRDKDTSLLSPVKSRLSEINMAQNEAGKETEMIRLVHPDHFNLAMKGLKDLLNVPDTSLTHTGSVSHMTLLDLDLSQNSNSSQSDQSDQFQRLLSTLGKSQLDSAILLLPMLQDYLQHYIDMLQTSSETPSSSSAISTSSSSESFESSSESPTGSLGILLRSTTTYANNLESVAVASLKTLCTLVNYDCVRKVLYYKQSDDLPPSNESSRPSSPIKNFPLSMLLKLRLIPKVIKLTTPNAKGQLANKDVVETSLTILEILARHAEGCDVNSLLPVLTEDVIQHCVETEEDPSFVLHGLLLFKALCKSKHVVTSLCSNSSGCVLLSIYSIGTGKKSYIERGDRHTLAIIKMVIESIFYIVCSHSGGIMILMDSDCPCSQEVVSCIVLLLYKVMLIYDLHRKDNRLSGSTVLTSEKEQESIQGTCLDILENGLQLLHLMSQHDPEFMSRHGTVQHSYVLLICGMSQSVKNLPAEKRESVLTAIQDLWDFNQDDSELSPDSDTDMNEDRE